jgi:hypothetical protein
VQSDKIAHICSLPKQQVKNQVVEIVLGLGFSVGAGCFQKKEKE